MDPREFVYCLQYQSSWYSRLLVALSWLTPLKLAHPSEVGTSTWHLESMVRISWACSGHASEFCFAQACNYSRVIIFGSPPKPWSSRLPSSLPLFKDKMGGILNPGQQTAQGVTRLGHQAKKMSRLPFAAQCCLNPVLGVSPGPWSLSCYDPAGFSRSFYSFMFFSFVTWILPG